jgi:uracil-DNA glycosylase
MSSAKRKQDTSILENKTTSKKLKQTKLPTKPKNTNVKRKAKPQEDEASKNKKLRQTTIPTKPKAQKAKQGETKEDETKEEGDEEKQIDVVPYDILPAIERYKTSCDWYLPTHEEMLMQRRNTLLKIQNNRIIYPIADDVLAATCECSKKKCRVVIVGQDPYISPGQAHGLCFSIPENHRPLPPSLQHIFDECRPGQKDRYDNPCLIGWANQGVLLLNAVLTVFAGQSNSHKGQPVNWEEFTMSILKQAAALDPPPVFLALGGPAYKLVMNVWRGANPKFPVLGFTHPAPLGFKAKSKLPMFYNSKCFEKVNNLLVQRGQDPIKW